MECEMKRSNRLIAIFLVLGMALFPHLLCAQNDKGSVAGHVSDSSGGLLQGAEIELQPTGRTVISNQQGAYFVNGLSAGTYTITVTYVGFSLFTRVVNVMAGQVATVDVKMEVTSQRGLYLASQRQRSRRSGALTERHTGAR
jgi:hypothetical protein